MKRDRLVQLLIAFALMTGILSASFVTPLTARAKAERRQYHNPTGDEFPIIGWGTFENYKLLTKKNYEKFKDAGFNIAFCYSMSGSFIDSMLDACRGAGVKVQLNLRNTDLDKNKDSTETFKNNYYINHINKYRDNSLVVGWNLWDEPTARQFGKVWERMQLARDTIGSTQYLYSNLTNSGADKSWLAPSYECYVKSYLLAVEPEMLSFDHYCIYKYYPNPKDKSKYVLKLASLYFYSLECNSQNAKKAGIPLWTFILGTPHSNYPEPTEWQVSFQAFTGLAYGSQCLQYYCYGYRESIESDSAGHGPTNIDGSINEPVWNAIQTVNLQVQKLAPHFLGMDLQKVWHTGKYYDGVTMLDPSELPAPFKNVAAGTKGVVVSYFTNNGYDYLFIVNKDFEHVQEAYISIDKLIMTSGFQKIFLNEYLANDKAADNNADITLPGHVTTQVIRIDPGSGCLYRWKCILPSATNE